VNPRTLTPAPTDRGMWRRLLRVVHPDAEGDDGLFVWCRHLQEHVVGDTPDPPIYERPRRTTSEATDSPRVPFDRAGSFDALTRQAVALADEASLPEVHARLLRLLADCRDVGETGGVVYRHQHQGASYKLLAAIGHRAGMTKTERTGWYRVCESIPLSQRHAGHILCKLQERAA
jgi:hypothetical protein